MGVSLNTSQYCDISFGVVVFLIADGVVASILGFVCGRVYTTIFDKRTRAPGLLDLSRARDEPAGNFDQTINPTTTKNRTNWIQNDDMSVRFDTETGQVVWIINVG